MERKIKMKLYEYIKEQDMGYGYVGATLQDNIQDDLKSIGIDDIIDDLHVTLIYDERNPVSKNNCNNKEYTGTIKDVEVLGEKDSKWRAITFVLDSDDFVNRHEELKEMGFQHSYSDFIPHMSIKYGPTDEDIQRVEDSLPNWKGKDLKFKEYDWEPVK